MTIDTTNNTIITTNALLTHKEGEGVKFLLVQENDGNWGLPGGAKEIEDTDATATIKRELNEELGINPSDYQLREPKIQREFEYNHFQSSRFGKHGIVKFFLVEVSEPSKIKMSGEIADIGWFSREETLEKLTFDHIKDGFKEASELIK